MNKIYIFHELIKPIKVKSDTILTFDDGHYSILKNINYISDLPNRKILFITPQFISLHKRREEPLMKRYYMDDFFIYGKKDQFLTLDEIELLISKYNFEIGMHSFYHDIVYLPRNLNVRYKYMIDKNRMWYYHKFNDKNLLKLFKYVSALVEPGIDLINGKFRKRTEEEYKEYVERDTDLCIKWFKHHLYLTKMYAFPFFQESVFLREVLKNNGIIEIYGKRENYFTF